jgi:thymidylate synthase (FAD)
MCKERKNMIIIKPSFKILTSQEAINEQLRLCEYAARICTDTTDKMKYNETNIKFLLHRLNEQHLTIFEHCNITVVIICDIGVSREFMRHRITSNHEQSTRYCNFEKSGHITFIAPEFFPNIKPGEYKEIPIDLIDSEIEWFSTMLQCERAYLNMVNEIMLPQEARNVLPLSIATKIISTKNLASWRDVFKKRALGLTGKPHPQMLEIMIPLLEKFKKIVPLLFDDLIVK